MLGGVRVVREQRRKGQEFREIRREGSQSEAEEAEADGQLAIPTAPLARLLSRLLMDAERPPQLRPVEDPREAGIPLVEMLALSVVQKEIVVSPALHGILKWGEGAKFAGAG